MKIGMIPVNVGQQSVEHMVGLAVLAEEIGFESLWTFEHVIVPVEYESKYPYDSSGKMGAEPETNFVDPLIALSAVAASTRTVRLGTGVNILPQSNPLYLAKQAASLDFVSNGRFMLGVGIGWLREEFSALGVPFERRGARFDDYVQAMRKVWGGEVVEHDSDFVQWSGFKSYPRPVQDPLPVIIGGSKGKGLRAHRQIRSGLVCTDQQRRRTRRAAAQARHRLCRPGPRQLDGRDLGDVGARDGGPQHRLSV